MIDITKQRAAEGVRTPKPPKPTPAPTLAPAPVAAPKLASAPVVKPDVGPYGAAAREKIATVHGPGGARDPENLAAGITGKPTPTLVKPFEPPVQTPIAGEAPPPMTHGEQERYDMMSPEQQATFNAARTPKEPAFAPLPTDFTNSQRAADLGYAPTQEPTQPQAAAGPNMPEGTVITSADGTSVPYSPDAWQKINQDIIKQNIDQASLYNQAVNNYYVARDEARAYAEAQYQLATEAGPLPGENGRLEYVSVPDVQNMGRIGAGGAIPDVSQLPTKQVLMRVYTDPETGLTRVEDPQANLHQAMYAEGLRRVTEPFATVAQAGWAGLGISIQKTTEKFGHFTGLMDQTMQYKASLAFDQEMERQAAMYGVPVDSPSLAPQRIQVLKDLWNDVKEPGEGASKNGLYAPSGFRGTAEFFAPTNFVGPGEALNALRAAKLGVKTLSGLRLAREAGQALRAGEVIGSAGERSTLAAIARRSGAGADRVVGLAGTETTLLREVRNGFMDRARKTLAVASDSMGSFAAQEAGQASERFALGAGTLGISEVVRKAIETFATKAGVEGDSLAAIVENAATKVSRGWNLEHAVHSAVGDVIPSEKANAIIQAMKGVGPTEGGGALKAGTTAERAAKIQGPSGGYTTDAMAGIDVSKETARLKLAGFTGMETFTKFVRENPLSQVPEHLRDLASRIRAGYGEAGVTAEEIARREAAAGKATENIATSESKAAAARAAAKEKTNPAAVEQIKRAKLGPRTVKGGGTVEIGPPAGGYEPVSKNPADVGSEFLGDTGVPGGTGGGGGGGGKVPGPGGHMATPGEWDSAFNRAYARKMLSILHKSPGAVADARVAKSLHDIKGIKLDQARKLIADIRAAGVERDTTVKWLERAGVFKSTFAAGDISGALRQGRAFLAHPQKFVPAFGRQLQVLVGKGKDFAEAQFSLYEKVAAAGGDEAGLGFTTTGSVAHGGEEAFPAGLDAVKFAQTRLGVPGRIWGRIVENSNEAYVSVLNDLSANVFLDNVNLMDHIGLPMDMEAKKALANTLNHARMRLTSYGTEHGTGAQIVMQGANTAFFAPGMRLARVAFVADFVKASARLMAATPKSLKLALSGADQPLLRAGLSNADLETVRLGAAWAISTAGLYAMAVKALGVESVELDPASTNFLRADLGEYGIAPAAVTLLADFTGVGAQQYKGHAYIDLSNGLGAEIRTVYRVLFGRYKGAGGEEVAIRWDWEEDASGHKPGAYDVTKNSVLHSYFTNAFSPAFRTISDVTGFSQDELDTAFGNPITASLLFGVISNTLQAAGIGATEGTGTKNQPAAPRTKLAPRATPKP